MTAKHDAGSGGEGRRHFSTESHDERLRANTADETRCAQRSSVAPLLVAFLTFCTTYMLAYVSKLPVLRYLPVERAWTLLIPTNGRLSMAYYGLLLLSLIAFFLALTIASLPPIRRVLSAPPITRVLAFLVACLAAGALILVAGVELLRP